MRVAGIDLVHGSFDVRYVSRYVEEILRECHLYNPRIFDRREDQVRPAGDTVECVWSGPNSLTLTDPTQDQRTWTIV